jgi:hypothetical protein
VAPIAIQHPSAVQTAVTTPSTRTVLPTNFSGDAYRSPIGVALLSVTPAPNFVSARTPTPNAIAIRTTGITPRTMRFIGTSLNLFNEPAYLAAPVPN